ncbi:MAG: MarR family winged helix-turn-helix transcriptional regulator [Anaerocolumna sp.]
MFYIHGQVGREYLQLYLQNKDCLVQILKHCSLTNPHCKKGKTLAGEKNKNYAESISTEADSGRNTNPDKEEWRRTQAEFKILRLFQNCYYLLSGGKGSKQGNKKNKIYILSLLADRGEWNQKELEDNSELSTVGLMDLLLKMKKKGYISLKQEKAADSKISITENGLELLKLHINKRSQGRTDIFSVLDEKEKDNLEHILKKIYLEWSK